LRGAQPGAQDARGPVRAGQDAGRRHRGPVHRVRRIADGEREYLQGVIEFYRSILPIKATIVGQTQNDKVQQLTEASYAQNEEIKKISSWAAIFFAPSLVAAVYGMNFDHMPELHWRIGYPFAIALMVAAALALHQAFKRRGWL
jgi:magnesium transporter